MGIPSADQGPSRGFEVINGIDQDVGMFLGDIYHVSVRRQTPEGYLLLGSCTPVVKIKIQVNAPCKIAG